MDEILEKASGQPSIKPLNYDALTLLKDPLYIKMGQTLADASTDQNSKIVAAINTTNRLRLMASQNGLPHDVLKEVIQRAPEDDVETVAGDDDDRMDDDDDDNPFGGGNPPPGGGGGAGSSSGPREDRRSGGGGGGGFGSRRVFPGAKGRSQGQGGIQSYAEQMKFGNPKPPPDAGGAAGSTALFRSNLEMIAQMEQLREETRRAQQQTRTVQEVHNHTTNNPLREIIREIHGPKETIIREFQQQLAPPPIPPQDNSQLIATLQAAMSQNVDLASAARQMGMSMAQMVEYMRKSKPDAIMASSSSNQPPPGPPPGG